jgi:hypothetical protein
MNGANRCKLTKGSRRQIPCRLGSVAKVNGGDIQVLLRAGAKDYDYERLATLMISMNKDEAAQLGRLLTEYSQLL